MKTMATEFYRTFTYWIKDENNQVVTVVRADENGNGYVHVEDNPKFGPDEDLEFTTESISIHDFVYYMKKLQAAQEELDRLREKYEPEEELGS